MFFVYILQSETHKSRYVGSTDDVQKRLAEHNRGQCKYTSGRMPWKLIYHETYGSRSEAMKRERFLKTGQGRKILDVICSEIV